MNTAKPHVIIFGGTSGIGLALAKHYLQQGALVTVCGRHVAKVPKDVLDEYSELSTYALDVSKPQDVSDFFLQVHKIDLFIYSAGYYFNERKLALTLEESERMLAVNLTGFQHAFQLASDKMKTQKSGHLVAVSSVAGTLRQANASLYGRLKRNMIDTSLSYRHALIDHNIHVSVVAPGYMNTERLRELNHGDASHKPFLLSETDAVKEIVFAIDNKLALYVFPKAMKRLVSITNAVMACLPTKTANWLLNKRR